MRKECPRRSPPTSVLLLPAAAADQPLVTPPVPAPLVFVANGLLATGATKLPPPALRPQKSGLAVSDEGEAANNAFAPGRFDGRNMAGRRVRGGGATMFSMS